MQVQVEGEAVQEVRQRREHERRRDEPRPVARSGLGHRHVRAAVNRESIPAAATAGGAGGGPGARDASGLTAERRSPTQAAMPPTQAPPSDTTVLVTGSSGFIAQHVVLRLLAAGYRVRGTVRSLARSGEVR